MVNLTPAMQTTYLRSNREVRNSEQSVVWCFWQQAWCPLIPGKKLLFLCNLAIIMNLQIKWSENKITFANDKHTFSNTTYFAHLPRENRVTLSDYYNQELLKHFRDLTAAPNRGRPDNAFPQGQEWATETKTSSFRSAKLLTRCGSHILLASPPAANICVCTFPFDLVSAVRDDNGVNSVLLAECLASWKRRHFWNFAVRYLQGSERRR